MKKQLPSQIHIILAVWSKEYCDNFLYKNLSTRLTSKGLLSLNKTIKVVYKIYAPQKDLDYIQNSKPFEKLAQTVLVELTPIEIDPNDKSSYKIFSKIHDLAIQNAYLCNAGMVFDSPDAIYGSSFFANLSKLIQAGYRLVLGPGVNLSLEDVYQSPTFNEKIINKDDYADETLISLALEYSHPERVLKRFQHQKIPLLASTLFWKTKGKNFFQQAFHTHPLYIYPEKHIRLLCQTIDYGVYLFDSCPSKKYHYYANCQELIFFELSKKAGYHEKGCHRASIAFFLLWAHSYAHKTQSDYFPRKKYYQQSPSKDPLFVIFHWFIFSYSFLILKKLPQWILKPFLFSTYKEVSQTPNLSFFRYLSKEFLWNYYETLLRSSKQQFEVEDLCEFIVNNRKKIRTKLFLRSDFFSHLNLQKQHLLLKKLKLTFPSKRFHKRLHSYLNKKGVNIENSPAQI